MIFLEQTVNKALLEEGQTIASLEDLQISWKDLENLFIGVYEEAKQYITWYDWEDINLSNNPTKHPDIAHITHITYPVGYAMRRMMGNYDGKMWEFNPYTKNGSSVASMNFAAQVSKYPTLEQLTYETELSCTPYMKCRFRLPCTFEPESFKFSDCSTYINPKKEPNKIFIEGSNMTGVFDVATLSGNILSDKEFKGTLSVKSRYVGLKEIDLSNELFYTWFKGRLLCYIGSMKKQIDLTGVGLPFDINADGLLEKGNHLLEKVEEQKCKKSNWSNF